MEVSNSIDIIQHTLNSNLNETTFAISVKHSSFRGRPLLGSEVGIPEGYCGYVLKKQHEDLTAKTKVFGVEQSFKKITNWNLDRIPSSDDGLISVMDWFDIAAAVSNSS